MRPARWVRISVAVATVGVGLAGCHSHATPKAVRPGWVRHLSASVSRDAATITWAPPESGLVARYQIHAELAGSDYGTRISTATEITWDRLPFGWPVRFEVTPVGPNGSSQVPGLTGPSTWTQPIVAADPGCGRPSTDCVVVDTLDPQGRETRPGAGLLHGLPGPDNPYVAPLRLTHWRIGSNNRVEYTEASNYLASADLIEVLSDGWYDATNYRQGSHTYVADPWANWTAYTRFIEGTVRAAEAEGQDPYWEIQNEPEYYDYSPAHPPTRSLVEAQYLHAYRAIRAADPHARIVGPSINWNYDVSLPRWYIDMQTFIPFAASHGMHLAAIAWHDNEDTNDGRILTYAQTPEAVRDHAEIVRDLLAEYPRIGRPLLLVDENSSGSGQFSPGWQAGYLAEEDRAGLWWANRSCWPYPEASNNQQGCFGPNLGDLLDPYGTPEASYWTMVDYAAMNGDRVWSGGNDPNLSGLAVLDSTGTVRILLGRHQTCSGWTAGPRYCATVDPPPPVPLTLTVKLPSTEQYVALEVQRIPDVANDLPLAPLAAHSVVAVVHGEAHIFLPRVDDGDAYFIAAAPARRA